MDSKSKVSLRLLKSNSWLAPQTRICLINWDTFLSEANSLVSKCTLGSFISIGTRSSFFEDDVARLLISFFTSKVLTGSEAVFLSSRSDKLKILRKLEFSNSSYILVSSMGIGCNLKPNLKPFSIRRLFLYVWRSVISLLNDTGRRVSSLLSIGQRTGSRADIFGFI